MMIDKMTMIDPFRKMIMIKKKVMMRKGIQHFVNKKVALLEEVLRK